MVDSCCINDSHPMEVVERQNCSLQKSWKEQQTVTTRVGFLAREAMVPFTRGCCQTVA
uniref:Wall-associated receptor kinase-like 22 n=1 Tax=Rhizophora mucronata TaxID=61149 RepID=A0A2P2JAP3_RHIMU